MEQWRHYGRWSTIPTPVAPADRPRRRRWRLPRRWLRRGLGGMMVVFLIWLLYWSPVFAIREVRLAGETTPVLENLAQQFVGHNLLRLSERRLTGQMAAAEPSLASLWLTRGLPNQLQIHLTRRQPALIWIIGETRWAVDGAGTVFPYDPVTAEGRPPVIDRRAQPVVSGQKIVTADFVNFVTQAGQDLPVVVGGRLAYGEIDETTVHLRFVTEWGWSVLLDTTRPLGGQLANLALVLKDQREQIHEYVDLRLAGWAYLK